MTFEYVCFLITKKCNLQCKYCYRMNADIDFMPQDKFKVYLEKLKTLGCKTLNITGGEALLHPLWKKYIQYAYDIGFRVILSTNAILLDLDDDILNCIDVLVIPLDGSCKKIDSISHGEEHFNILKIIIEKYKKGHYPFKLKINTVMTKDNYTDLDNMIPLIEGNNILWRIFFCKTKGKFNKISSEKLLSHEEYIYKIKELNKKIPNTIMYDTCIKDGNSNIAYTVIAPDGYMYITQGEDDDLIGSLDKLSANNVHQKVLEKGYLIEKHNETCGI